MKKEDKFTWYLKKPFDKEFDRSNWWEDSQYSNKKSNVSALYELARRHPEIGRLKLENTSVENQSSVRTCLILFGNKNWISLTQSEVKRWCSSIEKIKGIDIRSSQTVYTNYSDGALTEALEKIFGKFDGSSITKEYALAASLKSSTFKKSSIVDLTKPFSVALTKPLIDKIYRYNPVVQEIERRIAERAIQDYRKGRIILSVSPDLSYEKARKVLSTAYKEHKKPPASKQRSRWEEWLHKIKAYQDYQLQSRIKNPHLCTNYKRLFKNLDI